jgi:rRNA maturation protein Nop10
MKCAFCHEEIAETKIHIRDECPACGRDLHICLNCEFYDANAYRQCRESIRELIQDKEKANFCDFFRAAKSDTADTGKESDDFKKLQDLFK